MKVSNLHQLHWHSLESAINKSMDSLSNFVLKSKKNLQSGLLLASIWFLFFKKKTLMHHFGQDYSRARIKINISRSTGQSGLTKTNKKNRLIKEWEDSTLLKWTVFFILVRLRRYGRHARNGRIPRYGRNGWIPWNGWNARYGRIWRWIRRRIIVVKLTCTRRKL